MLQIINIKTGLNKFIDYTDWSIGDIAEIYDFYSGHKDYLLEIEGVFEL